MHTPPIWEGNFKSRQELVQEPVQPDSKSGKGCICCMLLLDLRERLTASPRTQICMRCNFFDLFTCLRVNDLLACILIQVIDLRTHRCRCQQPMVIANDL